MTARKIIPRFSEQPCLLLCWQDGNRVFYFFGNFSKSHWKKSLRSKFFFKVTEKCRWDFKSPRFITDFCIFLEKVTEISKVHFLSLISEKFLQEFSWIPTADSPLIMCGFLNKFKKHWFVRWMYFQASSRFSIHWPSYHENLGQYLLENRLIYLSVVYFKL